MWIPQCQPWISQCQPWGLQPCRCAKVAFTRAPKNSTLGSERTLDPAQTGTHQALFWGRRREGDRKEGGGRE